MNLRNIFAAAVLSILCVNCLDAATVILTLYANQNADGVAAPGQFRITAKVLGNDSAGLAGYGGDLTGNIVLNDHQSPRDASLQHSGGEGPAGFTFARSADNVKFVAAFQDISNPDAIPIYGFGQTNGSFAPYGPCICLPGDPNSTWKAELLIAAGTFTGPVGGPSGLGWNQNGPNRAANVFINNAGVAVRLPEELFLVVVPEPPAAALATIVLAGAAIRRATVCRCSFTGAS
jgi:hypothetical protein